MRGEVKLLPCEGEYEICDVKILLPEGGNPSTRGRWQAMSFISELSDIDGWLSLLTRS